MSLIKSYLFGLSQCVRFNNELSNKLPIQRGVPQGSILEPLLFLVYVNDFPAYVSLCNDCILYADDITLIKRCNNVHQLNGESEYLLDLANKWCTANELKMNTSKTQQLILSLRTHNLLTPRYVKFLGLCIDSKLRFSIHVEHVQAKFSCNLFVLRRLADNVSANVLKRAYFALCHTLLSYGVIVWGSSSSSGDLFRLQRRAIRIISSLGYRDDCRQAFIDLKILTLPCLFIFTCLCYAKANLSKYRQQHHVHAYDTRRKEDYRLPLSRLSITQKGAVYTAIRLYNHLPDDLKLHNGKAFTSSETVLIVKGVLFAKPIF